MSGAGPEKDGVSDPRSTGGMDQDMGVAAGAEAMPAVLSSGQVATASSTAEVVRKAVAACQQGEREAFDQLVVLYQRDIYRLCYRYVNNHEDANDLTQEAFLRAWRAIKRFRGQSAFSTWLYRIAVNACLNFRAARRPPSAELPEALPDPSDGADVSVEREDEAWRLRRAVSRLPEKQRATLILKIYHELTHQEVAAALGSTVGTVKANLFHALGNLKRLVAEGNES